MSEKEKVQLAIKMCEEDFKEEFQSFFKIYPFTTENLAGWMPVFDFFDKSFLTVGSSCDQTINAAYLGSKQQTIIDINSFVKEYFNLKKAGLMVLSRNEFLDFFCSFHYNRSKNPNVFNRETFKKIVSPLREYDYSAYLFWGTLFDQYNGDFVKKHLFLSDEERCSPIIQKMNLYLNTDSSYYKTKKAIELLEIDFIEADIYQYTKFGNYDNINLSNIGQYAKSSEELSKYLYLAESLIKHLNVNGAILLMYFFGTTRNNLPPVDDPDFISPIYNIDETIRLFQEYSVELHKFSSIKEFVFGDSSSPDNVMVYRKK